MKKWIAALLALMLLLQALPVTALATAVSGRPITEAELAKAYAIAGLNDGAGVFHNGMGVSASMNALQLSDWLEEMQSGDLYSVGHMLARVHSALADLKQSDPETWRQLTQTDEEQALVERCDALQLEAEDLRQTLRFTQDRLQENVSMVRQMGSLLDGGLSYDHEIVRYSERIRNASGDIGSLRDEILAGSDAWSAKVDTWQSIVNGSYTGNSAVDGAMGDWIDRVFAAGSVQASAQVKLSTSGASTRASRLSADEGVLANDGLTSTTVKVLTKDQLGFQVYNDDDQPVQGVVIRLRDADSTKDPMSATTGADGIAVFQISAFTVDEDGDMALWMEADAEAAGYRSFCNPTMDVTKGSVNKVCLKANDNSPYVYKAAFNKHDIRYNAFEMIYSKNVVENFNFELETRNATVAPVLCLLDKHNKETVYTHDAKRSKGNVYVFRDAWKSIIDPDNIDEVYFRWGEGGDAIDVLFTPIRGVFDEPTDKSSVIGGLEGGFGFSFDIPWFPDGVTRSVDVSATPLEDFKLSIAVDPLGSVVLSIGGNTNWFEKMNENWQNKEMADWKKLTKGIEKDWKHFRENRADLKDHLAARQYPFMSSASLTAGFFLLISATWKEKDGKTYLEGKGTVGGTVTFGVDVICYVVAAGIPLFLDFGLSLSLTLALSLVKFNFTLEKDPETDRMTVTDFGWGVDLHASFSFNITISLTLGAGIKGLLTIWVRGSGGFTFFGSWLEEGFMFTITASAGISGGLTLFFFSLSMDIVKGEWPLYPKKKSYSLLEHYLPGANADEDEQAANPDEPETYPQLVPEQKAELTDLKGTAGDFRTLVLGSDVYAIVLQDGRIHWYNLVQGVDGDIAGFLPDCQARYDDGANVAGMKDYAFDACVASAWRSPDARGVQGHAEDFIAVAGLCAENLDENGRPVAGESAYLYTLYLWRATDGTLVPGLNGDTRQLTAFRSAQMGGGEGSISDYIGIQPDIIQAEYRVKDNSDSAGLHHYRSYEASALIEFHELDDTQDATQETTQATLTLNTTCDDNWDTGINDYVPKIEKYRRLGLANTVNSDAAIPSGAGEDYARVFTRYISGDTWVAVSRSEGGNGKDGAIELYSPSKMNAAAQSVVLAKGDISRFTVVPSLSNNSGWTLFYADDAETDEDFNKYMLKGLRISPIKWDLGYDRFSTVETAYDVDLPTDNFRIRQGSSNILYWASTGPTDPDGKALYRIHYAAYDSNSNTLSDDTVFAEFSLPDGMALRDLFLTENGTWYFTAGGVPDPGPKDNPTITNELKPLTLYSFPTQMAPVLELKNQVVTDLLVCPGDFDDITVTIMNSGNLPATSLNLDLMVLDNGEQRVETLHADLMTPRNSFLAMADGTPVVTGEKAFYRLEDFEFTARQRDFVISEQKTNYTYRNGAQESVNKEDANSEYVKSSFIMPGSKAVFKGSIKIPDDWENDVTIELRLSSFSSSLNWAGAMAVSNGRTGSIEAAPGGDAGKPTVLSALDDFDEVTWVRDAETSKMMPQAGGTNDLYGRQFFKAVDIPESLKVSAFHDLEVHHRVYRGSGNERMLAITVTDHAHTGESVHLTAAVYVDDAENPFYVNLPYVPNAVSDNVTHTYDMPISALVDPNACQKARIVILGLDVEECALSNNEFTLYLDGKPDPLIILRQPRDVTIQEGESASFSVGVTGGVWPYGYQWQIWDAKHKKWVDIPGATGSALSREKVEKKWDGAQFRCVVTDRAGTTVISDSATLHVRDSVDTGDHSNLPLYLSVAVIALALLWLLRRRMRQAR